MTDAVLWTLFFVAAAGLVFVQVAAARAARKIGGSSSRWVLVLRAVNLSALLALLGWVVWQQFWR